MKRRWICALLALLLLLPACGGGTVPPAPEEPDVPPQEEAPPREPEPPEDPEEVALRSLLSGMSLEERVGQLFFALCPTRGGAEDVMTYHLGGYLLFWQNTRDKTANDLIQELASYQRASYITGIPLLIGADEEGGDVVRLSSNAHLRGRRFTSPLKLWAQGVEAVEAEAHEKDLLLRAMGVNVNMNPVADVSTAAGDYIHNRTTGGGVDEASDYVTRVLAIQSQDGLGSVLKHFPGYGSNRDTHNGIALDERPLETFREQDFLPFRAGIAAGETSPPMPAVLVSHNIVKAMDPDLPASLSPEVHRVLREELGFDGVVMTDDLSMDAVAKYAVDGNVAVMALQAGNDLLITADYRTQIPRVIEAAQNGTLDEAVIDAACYRCLRWKMELGLLVLTDFGALEAAPAFRG